MEKDTNTGSEKSLALEILEEVKLQSKRWMVAFFVILGLWAATIGTFVWYINQYDYSDYDIQSHNGGNANFVGRDGDITNGTGQSKNENSQER